MEIQSQFWQRHSGVGQQCVVGLFWELRSAPLHLKRQKSFISLTNRSLPMCVFPEVIYTWCCLCWGLACSVICMWWWSCGWFVPLMADSHGLKQPFSCPWVAVRAGTQKATGLVKGVSSLHDTQYECLESWPKGRAAAARPWGCIIALISRREDMNIKECSQLPILSSKNLSGLWQWCHLKHVLKVCFSEGICLNIFSK